MSMEQFPKKEIETLWAPWRVEYFEKEPRDMEFLMAAGQASDDAAHLVIARRKTAFLMMNRYPYSVGHLMAVAYRKKAGFPFFGGKKNLGAWDIVGPPATPLLGGGAGAGVQVCVKIGAIG